MGLKLLWICVLTIVHCRDSGASSIEFTSFEGNKNINVTEGNLVRLTWQYEISPSDSSDFMGILIGQYSGTAFTKVFAQVLPKGDFRVEDAAFAGRLSWEGLVVQQKATFVLNVTHSDSGKITCGLDLDVKGYVPSTVTVNVWVGPSVSVKPKYLFANKGDVATVSCESTGIPQPDIFWEIPSGPQSYIGVENGTDNIIINEGQGYSNLTFTNITVNNSREYVCRGTNPTEKDATASVLLNVYYIEEKVSTVISLCGTEKLFCPVAGYPPPSFKWTLPNNKPSNVYQDTLQQDGSGTYSCTAYNSEGNATVEIAYCSVPLTCSAGCHKAGCLGTLLLLSVTVMWFIRIIL